ncbi:hypothetical protein K9N68_09370 [Kovacikia minuta CCNUW1]|uniref:hypothetical protein n=1 Tax=Kovacikia minuta TaxID=2931930 RepID=UPI001CCC62A3|nr:hypothetical protein [Kovacikia minuta]UBF28068.1 hypothetical protein K9N68_09370 [Kovacikia minuta CCNUW1]
MSASAFLSANTADSNATPGILQSRSQYRSCHIRIPGEEQRFAAILVNEKYYSLVKVVRDRQKALEICTRLVSKGNEPLITPIAKGVAIWRLEPNARPDPISRPQSSPQMDKPLTAPTCKVLGLHNSAQTCRIRVPDLSEPLKAILVDGKYYGLFKVVEDRKQSLELAARLGLRGDETVITKTAQGDAVWVFEADAIVIR